MSHHGFFSQLSTAAADGLNNTTELESDMMLRDWLGETVQHDLELASLWKDIGIDANGFLDTNSFSQIKPALKDEIEQVRDRHDNGDFEEDEDRLAIIRLSSGPDQWPVQLLNFTKKSAPVQARLSDGTTYVYAKFKAQSLQAFHRKHARNFTDSGEGCVLRLKAFKILATAHGSPHDRVSLLITDFESDREWHSSRQRVGNPSALHKSPGIEHQLEKLLGLELPKAASRPSSPKRGKQFSVIDNCQSSTGDNDAPFSPASAVSQIHEASTTESQFATQLPPQRTSAIVDPAPNLNILSFIAKKPPKSDAPEQGVTMIAPASPQRNIHGRIGTIKTGQRGSPSDGQPQSSIIEPTGCPTVNEASPQDGRRNVPHPSYPPQRQVEDDAEADTRLETAPTPPAQQRIAVAEEVTPNNPSTPRGRHIAPGVADHGAIQSDVQQAVERPNIATNDPWASVTFPLPNLSVPREQQAILKESHSWYPAAPGRSFPAGNVPQAVLQWAEAQGRLIIEKRKEAAAFNAKAEGSPNSADVDNQSKKAISTDSGEGDSPDGTALSWSGSESGDENEEDDSKSSVDFIDPMPTMPSPFKASPTKKRPGMELPPDSSEPSPQRAGAHRMIAEPQDSDDEMMDFEVPHAKAESDARPEVLAVHAESERARNPDAEPAAAQSATMVQHEEFSSFVPANGEELFQEGPVPLDRLDDEIADMPNTSPPDTEVDEPHCSPPAEAPLTLEPELELPPDSPLKLQVGDPSVHEVATKKATPDDEAPESIKQDAKAILTTAADVCRDGMRMSSAEPQALASLRRESRAEAPISTTQSTKSVNRTPYNNKTDRSRAQPLGDPITFVQSTYPGRSAQKRKADVQDLSESSPKRVKQGRSRYGFSQDTPPPADYRKQNQRDKREFLKQRRHERAPTPEAERAHQRVEISSSSEVEEYEAEDEAPKPIAVHVDVDNDRQSSAPMVAEAQKAPKRKLPWQSSGGINNTSRPTAPRQPPSSSPSSTPQRLAGWRQRSIEHLAPSARNSPEAAAGTPQRLAGWRRRSIEHFVSSARSNPPPIVRPPPSSSGATDQQRSRLSSSASGTPQANSASRRTAIGFVAPSRVPAPNVVVARQSAQAPQTRLDDQAGQELTEGTSTQQSNVDGPVKAFHRDWKNLKSVRRHLCEGEDELKQRHPKRWNVRGWKV